VVARADGITHPSREQVFFNGRTLPLYQQSQVPAPLRIAMKRLPTPARSINVTKSAIDMPCFLLGSGDGGPSLRRLKMRS
jgi:hypothetical protein